MNPVLIVIAGPTAVGKTKTAIRIAKKFGSDILSADSRQFYRELKIGVATPTEDELNEVKHHFVGNLIIEDEYNVSRFENEVIGFLDNYFKTHRFAVMVGGSGLYIDAVCKGIDDLPDPDPEIRTALKTILKNEGIESLQNELKKVDPDFYELVDLKNPKRVIRALEVFRQTGKPYSALRKRIPKNRNFKIIKIGLNLPREELNRKIEARVDQMIKDGLVDEVKNLIKYRHLNALNTVGYKEIFEYLDRKQTLDWAIEKIKTNTRRYAKRQMTWFKKDPEMHWFRPENIDEIEKFIRNEIRESGGLNKS